MRAIILFCTAMFVTVAYPEYTMSTSSTISIAFMTMYAAGYDLAEYLKKK